MSNDLTQPPCSYCGCPTEPVRQKKLESTKYFYCSSPCEKKHTLLSNYESKLDLLDVATKTFVKTKLKVAIDMLYTSDCLGNHDCILIFTDSTNSFKLSGDIRGDYKTLLGEKGKELLEDMESLLKTDKMRITKNV